MRISDCWTIAAGLLSVACATSPQPPSEPVATATPAAAATSRPPPYPVFETREFASAVDRGTRTRSGRPGSSYWQQYSTYRLEATYDPASRRLTGRGTMRYENRSPDTPANVFLHLYPNLFAPDAIRNEAVPVTGGLELRRVAINGQVVAPAPNDGSTGYQVSSTILRVPAPSRLAPGAPVQLEIESQYTVPPDCAPRAGDAGEVA